MKLTDLTPNLITNDIDRSLTFYRDVLGFAVISTVPEEPPLLFVWLKRDDVNIFINDAHAVHEETPVGSLVVGQSGVALFRSEEHTSELQSQSNLVCRLLLEKTKTRITGDCITI